MSFASRSLSRSDSELGKDASSGGVETFFEPVFLFTSEAFCVLTFATTFCVAFTESWHRGSRSCMWPERQARIPCCRMSQKRSMDWLQTKGTDLPTSWRQASEMSLVCLPRQCRGDVAVAQCFWRSAEQDGGDRPPPAWWMAGIMSWRKDPRIDWMMSCTTGSGEPPPSSTISGPGKRLWMSWMDMLDLPLPMFAGASGAARPGARGATCPLGGALPPFPATAAMFPSMAPMARSRSFSRCRASWRCFSRPPLCGGPPSGTTMPTPAPGEGALGCVSTISGMSSGPPSMGSKSTSMYSFSGCPRAPSDSSSAARHAAAVALMLARGPVPSAGSPERRLQDPFSRRTRVLP
mmetsp:Transcript_20181/g.44524  ORF Transcript_20181/g.44524 Transcript_20181/m.44524 type:complete len:350 (-) Transcript_20181:8-1057(-)